jgi:hypothetical protein
VLVSDSGFHRTETAGDVEADWRSQQVGRLVSRCPDDPDGDYIEQWAMLPPQTTRFAGQGIKVNVYGATLDPATIATIHPSLIKQLPMNHTAEIETHFGWWFKYTVHRLHGIGIPESSVSHHRTLKSARRAVRRWEAQDSKRSEVVE